LRRSRIFKKNGRKRIRFAIRRAKRSTTNHTNLDSGEIYYKYAISRKREIRGSCPKVIRELHDKITDKNPLIPSLSSYTFISVKLKSLLVRAGSSHCRTPKGVLALLQTAALLVLSLCGIIHLHGCAVRYLAGSWLNSSLFVWFVVNFFSLWFVKLEYIFFKLCFIFNYFQFKKFQHWQRFRSNKRLLPFSKEINFKM
jgi:hypothetical protein